MLSRRQIALQGLTVKLTAIMIAVLGLWPEPEEEIDLTPFIRVAPKGLGFVERKKVAQDDDETWRIIRRVRSNAAAVMAALAFAELEYA